MSEPAATMTRQNGVCRLEWNRPDALNSLVPEMADAALDAVHAVSQDTAARVFVLSGKGRAFMAGGDLTYLRYNSTDIARRLASELITKLNNLVLAIRALPIPTLAVVHGAIAGAGLSLMLACDFAIADEGSAFHYAYGKIGAPPDGGLSHFLASILGQRRALAFAFLDPVLTAKQALEARLINRLAPAADLDAQASALAGQLMQVPQPAFRNTKRLVAASTTEWADAMAAERDSFRDCIGTPDFVEGITAFFERRPPVFLGAAR